MELPKSIREESMTVFGVELRCHVLDNGQRIIEADDVHTLFRAMSESGLSDEEIDEISLQTFGHTRH